jgi:hypothetical protein
MYVASLSIILDFLADLHMEGKAYRSINVFQSMLSSTLDQIDRHDVGKHPLVVKKSIFNSNSPKPRYSIMRRKWDTGFFVKKND